MIKVTTKFSNSFTKLQKNIEELSKKAVSFNELFTTDFLNKCSSFNNIDDLISNSPFNIKTKEDFLNIISNEEWDSYIKSVTIFNSWKDMQLAASNSFVKNKLAV